MNRSIVICAFALLCFGIAASADVFNMPAGLKSLETVVVGDPGNRADDTGFGAVAYPFKIGKFEVTASQYVEFLNSKGKSEPDGSLWKNDMAEEDAIRMGCEIRREGEKGSYAYSVGLGSSNRPVNNVSFWDACRFCNWLHNGQGDGDTEDGAYTLSRELRMDARKVKRNPGAKWFIPNEDEWYKAAYYDPGKAGGAGYWDYPTRRDAKPGRDFSSANAANWYDGSYLDSTRYLTEVGAFAKARSAYGTLDQAGNVYEMTESLVGPFLRCLWGGSYGSADGGLNRRAPNEQFHSAMYIPFVGFRVAGTVPETPANTVSHMDSTPPEKPTNVSFPRRPWRDPETGKPFFPMGWFSGDALGPFENAFRDMDEMASQGVNAVIWYSVFSDVDDDAMLRRNLGQVQRYLDHAHKVGIKVLVHLGGWYGAYQRNDTAEIARQRQWVKAVCTHPALLGYQLYDEPEGSGGDMLVESQKQLAKQVEAFRKQRAAIREWDANPHHTVQVVFNRVPLSNWKAFLPVIDSFQVDRYPCGAGMPYFGQQGDWGLLIMAWSMAHGTAALNEHPHLLNPSPCMQGVGLSHREGAILGLWRDPLYDETRYMAYSSITAGSWGVFHWIRNFVTQPNSAVLLRQVGRLHTELRQLMPAFEQSYEKPPFSVSHNHEGITRDFLTDCISDISTLTLEDKTSYYLIVSDNSGVFEDVTLRMKLPGIKDTKTRDASVLNEDWSREIKYDSETEEWVIATHKMCFGDINIWVIPKVSE